MKLSEILINYRQRMNISQRELSRRCDLSNSYISFLENEFNPKTGRPIAPTLEQYKKLADGMKMSLQELFEQLDTDAPVSLSLHQDSSLSFSTEEVNLILAYRVANPGIQSSVRKLLDIPEDAPGTASSAI